MPPRQCYRCGKGLDRYFSHLRKECRKHYEKAEAKPQNPPPVSVPRVEEGK